MSLTGDQLQQILAHDEPTDLWLLDWSGTSSFITVVPEQDPAKYQVPGQWPRYIAQSKMIDNIVLARGYEPALEFVNRTIELLMAPPTLTSRAATITGRFLAKRLAPDR